MNAVPRSSASIQGASCAFTAVGSDISQKLPLSVFGKYFTLILIIFIVVGNIWVEQLVPEYPCGQSHPQSGLEIPPFKQGIGVHAGVELESSFEHPKNIATINNIDTPLIQFFIT